jgi:outer membrane protein assembly factor BamB
MNQKTERSTLHAYLGRMTHKFDVTTKRVVVTLLSGILFLLSACGPGSVVVTTNTVHPVTFTHLYLISTGPDGLTNKRLSELNTNSGQVIWQQQLANDLLGYGISSEGNIYLPAQDGNIFVFRGRDGQPLWHTTTMHEPRGFTSVWLSAYQNSIIESVTNTPNSTGGLSALDAKTGNVMWHTPLSCDASSSNDCAAGGRLMLLANGTIYGLAQDGLSAWNPVNGHFLWRNPNYKLNGQPQSMVVSHGNIYITNFYPEVDVLNASSGNFLHRLKPLDSQDSTAVVYDVAAGENTVYVLGGRAVFAYRTSDDSLLWKQSFSYHSGGTIYAGESGIYVNYYDISMGRTSANTHQGYNLYALDPANGHQLWRQQAPVGGLEQYPVEFANLLCFGGSGNVYGLQSRDGKQLWQFYRSGYNSLLGG